MRRLDLTGKSFGKLTVLKEGTQRGYTRYWKCKCDCGNIKLIRQSSLTTGNSKSCGCVKGKNIKDLTGKRFGKLTVIEKKGRSGGRITWKCKCDCGNYTEIKGNYLTTGQTKSCGCLKKEMNKENLRNKYDDKYVENINTALLKSKIRSDNKSGVKGVCRERGKWVSYIGYAGKQINLGRFTNLSDAIKARKKAEEKYHKPFLEENNNEND